MMHGKGKLKYSDGRVFEGNFVRGREEGHGLEHQPDGTVRKG